MNRTSTGARVVSAAKQYREFAEECMGWAKTAKTDRERDIFLQMARTWFAAAIRAGADPANHQLEKLPTLPTIPIMDAD
jgi:hypothetical protein